MEKTRWNNITNAAKAENLLHRKSRFIVWFLSIIGTIIGYSAIFDDIIRSTQKINQPYYDSNYDDISRTWNIEWNDFNMLGFFFCFIACISGISLTIKTFAELHHRTTSDMQFALPLSSSQRFISKLLSLGHCYFLPLVAPPAVAGLVASITSLFCPNVEGVAFTSIWAVVTVFMLGLITVFTVSIVAVSCGRAAEPAYMSIILGVGLSFILPDIVYLISVSNPYSYTGYDMFGKMSFCTYVLVAWSGEVMSDPLSLIVNLLLCILIFAVVMYLSYRIYKKRDGRSVGQPIVFHAVFEIILFLGIFLSVSAGLNYITVAISFVVYMIIRIVSQKENFKKKVPVWVGLYVAYVLIVPLFLLASNATNGFGTDNKIIREIKKADSIERMDVTLTHYYYANSTTYKDVDTDAESEINNYSYSSNSVVRKQYDNEQVKEFLAALVENSKELKDISDKNYFESWSYYRSRYTYALADKYDKYYRLDIDVSLSDDRDFEIDLYFDDADKAKEFAEFINENPFDAKQDSFSDLPENSEIPPSL